MAHRACKSRTVCKFFPSNQVRVKLFNQVRGYFHGIFAKNGGSNPNNNKWILSGQWVTFTQKLVHQFCLNFFTSNFMP